MRYITRRWVLFWLCCFALLLCWCSALAAGGRLSELGETLGLRYAQSEGLSPSALKRAAETAVREKETAFPEVTLWELLGRQDIFAAGELHEKAAEVLLLDGDCSAVLPLPLLSGSFPAQSDPEGCAIDRSLALSLYGSESAVGNRLLWNRTELVVRGVFDAGSPFVLAQSGPEAPERLFRNAELRFSGKEATPQDARQFLTRYALDSPAAIADAPLFRQAGGLLLHLPAWIMAIWLLARLIKRAYSLHNQPRLCIVFSLAALLSAVVFLWLCQAEGTLPTRFIPSLWSDFSFWSRLWREITAELRALLSMGLPPRELLLLRTTGACLLPAIGASLLALPLLARLRARSWKSVFFSAAAWLLLASFFSQSRTAPEGVAAGRAVWLALPCCFLLDYLLFRWDEWLCPPRRGSVPLAPDIPQEEDFHAY